MFAHAWSCARVVNGSDDTWTVLSSVILRSAPSSSRFSSRFSIQHQQPFSHSTPRPPLPRTTDDTLNHLLLHIFQIPGFIMTTTQPTTTFSTINTDVQNYLAKFLDNESLLSMRQVDREASRNVESQFISRFFIEREHLVTVHSMRALADLTTVP